jgi:hypothetical protein
VAAFTPPATEICIGIFDDRIFSALSDAVALSREAGRALLALAHEITAKSIVSRRGDTHYRRASE